MNAEPVALALSAGGARGAYQAGALLYFAEQGLVFNAVAGTSIGSLNGAHYASGDGSAGHVGGLLELWRQVAGAGLIRVGEDVLGRTLEALLGALFAGDASGGASVLAELSAGGFAVLDPRPVSELLDRWLDYQKICESHIRFTVVVLPETLPLLDITPLRRKAVYLDACDLGPAGLKNALLAAAAIPLAFPSQQVNGRSFSDAGLDDPLPAKILYRRGARRILSVFLSDHTLQNRMDFPGVVLFQLRPSVNIDSGLPSTFDFSRKSIEGLINLGYRDAASDFERAGRLAGLLPMIQRQGRENQERAESLPDRSKRPIRRTLLPR